MGNWEGLSEVGLKPQMGSGSKSYLVSRGTGQACQNYTSNYSTEVGVSLNWGVGELGRHVIIIHQTTVRKWE